MHTVVLTELGIAVMDGKACARAFAFADDVAEYMAVRDGSARVRELAEYAAGLDSVAVSDAALLGILRAASVDAEPVGDEEAARLRESRLEIIVQAGLAKDREEATARLREFAMNISSARVAEVSQSADQHIIQAIRTMDEADKALNAAASRLREWYGLHFPELENVVDAIATYARIASIGRRSDITAGALEQAGVGEPASSMIAVMASKSRGGDVTDANLAVITRAARDAVELGRRRRELEEHVTAEMLREAPNTSAILGALIGARVMARAGGLARLASMPASSIQVLGAEKALFRSLKTGARPPKHGLLFQHQLVHAAPRWQRGKMARAIAAKAAIAARVDMYGSGLNETLLEKLNVRAGQIGAEPRPPPREPRREARSAPAREGRRRGARRRPRRFDRARGRRLRARDA